MAKKPKLLGGLLEAILKDIDRDGKLPFFLPTDFTLSTSFTALTDSPPAGVIAGKVKYAARTDLFALAVVTFVRAVAGAFLLVSALVVADRVTTREVPAVVGEPAVSSARLAVPGSTVTSDSVLTAMAESSVRARRTEVRPGVGGMASCLGCGRNS